MNLEFTNAKEAKQIKDLQNTKEYSFANLGELKDIKDYISENTDLGLKSTGKIFLKNILNLTGAEISLNYIPENTKAAFLHTHKENEEVYIVLQGNGEFIINDNKLKIKAGSVIKVSTNAKRGINSGDNDLIVIVIQTKENSLNYYTLSDAEIVK
ncbi:MAG: cupin domain-containing protein [Clostridiaceae bacterium]|jgi:uncharacterized cupin superfamily protein|nr:cupin domain-containing protein [Clostridiaceae bacterium]